jgi:hypothetical protein
MGNCGTCEHWKGEKNLARGWCLDSTHPAYVNRNRDRLKYSYDEGCEFWESAEKAEQARKAAQQVYKADAEKAEQVRKANAEKAEQVRKAAEQGDAQAQCELGVLYENGQGVPIDHRKAAEWFGKAATQGHAEAKEWLAKAKDAAKEEAKKAVFPLALGGIIGGLLLLFFPQIVVGGDFATPVGIIVLLFLLVIGGALLAGKLFGGCLSVIIGIIIGFIAWVVLFALFWFIREINIPSVYRLVSTVSGAVVGALIGLLVKTIVEEW